MRRAIPLHAGHWTNAHAFGCQRHIVIEHRGHRQLEHQLAVVARDDVQNAFLAGRRDELLAAGVEQ